MTPKSLILIFVFIFTLGPVWAAQNQDNQRSEQQINDFSLAGYGEKGKKTWDVTGKTADVFTDTVELKDITGNLYGEKEDVKLTADKGYFDKQQAKMHLQDNVVVTTSSGAQLTTDSLDWDRRSRIVSTKDQVNVAKDNMVTIADGATGEPSLNRVTFEKDVTVEINPSKEKKQEGVASKSKVIITCDGPLQIDYEKNIAVFNNNVKVDREDSQIYSDTMEVYFTKSEGNAVSSEQEPLAMGSNIDKIIAKGNVRIVRGENTSYSEEAVYTAADKKITLTGKPKLILYSTEDINAPSGN